MFSSAFFTVSLVWDLRILAKRGGPASCSSAFFTISFVQVRRFLVPAVGGLVIAPKESPLVFLPISLLI